MYVKIHARNIEISRTLKEWIERRLHFALARFGGRIRCINTFVEDINGPRGGEDQRCKIEVNLVPSGSITAEATDVDAASAVSRAAQRVSRRVRDTLDRKHTMRTRKSWTPGEDDVSAGDL